MGRIKGEAIWQCVAEKRKKTKKRKRALVAEAKEDK
jgi:hypothetical protein